MRKRAKVVNGLPHLTIKSHRPHTHLAFNRKIMLRFLFNFEYDRLNQIMHEDKEI